MKQVVVEKHSESFGILLKQFEVFKNDALHCKNSLIFFFSFCDVWKEVERESSVSYLYADILAWRLCWFYPFDLYLGHWPTDNLSTDSLDTNAVRGKVNIAIDVCVYQ